MSPHLPRRLSLIAAAIVPFIAVAALATALWVQTSQSKHAAKVACLAARNSDLGLVHGLTVFLETGPRAHDPETARLLVFLRHNVDVVFTSCVSQIH